MAENNVKKEIPQVELYRRGDELFVRGNYYPRKEAEWFFRGWMRGVSDSDRGGRVQVMRSERKD